MEDIIALDTHAMAVEDTHAMVEEILIEDTDEGDITDASTFSFPK